MRSIVQGAVLILVEENSEFPMFHNGFGCGHRCTAVARAGYEPRSVNS
jgi:hypothetical protein